MHKLIVSSLALVLVTLGWGNRSLGEQGPAPRGELRIVDKEPFNWASITANVMEELLAPDKDGKLVPRLATSWHWRDDRTLEFTLRQGVTFHNGEVFDAEIVRLNWEDNTRAQQPHVAGLFMNFAPGSRLETPDPYTVRLVLPEPDSAALIKFAFMHIANRQFYRDVGWGEKSW